MDEDYFFQIEDEITDDRLFILIIYDITNNSKRVKFAKLLLGYVLVLGGEDFLHLVRPSGPLW